MTSASGAPTPKSDAAGVICARTDGTGGTGEGFRVDERMDARRARASGCRWKKRFDRRASNRSKPSFPPRGFFRDARRAGRRREAHREGSPSRGRPSLDRARQERGRRAAGHGRARGQAPGSPRIRARRRRRRRRRRGGRDRDARAGSRDADGRRGARRR
eukprot:31485-Pelagococcus_subviridis.AAC.17